ncbi:radical SAM protein [Candidatus Pacearchaeota archaeon]|nr:radical SAM protein [Candidatus Pacearchaeota archaeon]
MKIVFIYPNFYRAVKYKKKDNVRATPLPPLGPLALGSYLHAKGYDVKIIDMRLDCNDLDVVLEEVKDASLVGFSVMTLQVKDALKISEAIKQKYDVPIVWGDSHPSLFPKQIGEPVDFAVYREGEETILELIEALKHKTPFKDIKGLVYRNNGDIVMNPPRDYLDMDKLPAYNYDLIPMDYYVHGQVQYTFKEVRKVAIETSRGCPHRCAFCINVLQGRNWRMKSAERVLNEIKNLVSKYGVNHITIIDPNFFVNKERVKKICEGLIDLKISWDADCRADYFKQGFLDDDLLPLIKKSGCHRLIIGVESGSPIVLDMIKKDVSVENLLNCAKQCNKYGIIPLMSFMIGIPNETKKDIIMTLDLKKRMKKICPRMESGFAVFMPYPGGELYDFIVKEGLFKEPGTIREWAKEENLKLMDSENVNVPWNKKNEKYILNVHYYANLAYIMTRNQFFRMLRKNFIIAFGLLFFVLLARIRWQLNFYYIAFDRYLYYKAKKILRIL